VFFEKASQSIGLLLSITLAGFLVGNALLLVGWPQTPQVEYFTSTPDFLIWLSLVSLLFAILPLCALYGTMVAVRLRIWSRRYKGRSLFSLSLLFVLFFLPYTTLSHFPEILPPVDLPTFELRVNIVTLFCNLCAVPAAISLLLLHPAIKRLDPDSPQFLPAYFQNRTQLNGLLTAFALIIGLGTLTTGALQNALTALYTEFNIGSQGNTFPSILTAVYGGYFSLILLLLYWPLERALAEVGQQFLDSRIPLPQLTSDQWKDLHDKRQQARSWLNLDKSLLNLQSSLTILTPLASGLLSYLLPK
jgi:hypothetical protein